MQEYVKGSEEWQLAVNGHQPRAGNGGAAPSALAPADDDVPFAGAATSATRPALGRSKFDDMADDIPF
jgi:hypothetical protein